MIIRLSYLASALSLAAASKSKSAKTPVTPRPTDAAKASKSNTPIASNEYFLAPFSCPKGALVHRAMKQKATYLKMRSLSVMLMTVTKSGKCIGLEGC